MENHADNKSMKLVWAIDPYEMELRPSPETLEQLKVLTRGSLANVTPVFVRGLQPEDAVDDLKEVRKYILSFTGEVLGEPVLIYTGSTSKAVWIEKFLDFAKENKAEMLLLTSHGRGGFSRLVLGSFAQSLLEQSNVPILFLQPKVRPGGDVCKALFATDFSKESEGALKRFLEMFASSLTEVTLFHSVSLPEETPVMTGVAGLPVAFPEPYLEEKTHWAHKECELWIKRAATHSEGLKFNYYIDEGVTMSMAASIKKYILENQIGLVGLVSHAGPLEKFVFGSVAQDLLASRLLFVWALGPKFKE